MRTVAVAPKKEQATMILLQQLPKNLIPEIAMFMAVGFTASGREETGSSDATLLMSSLCSGGSVASSL